MAKYTQVQVHTVAVVLLLLITLASVLYGLKNEYDGAIQQVAQDSFERKMEEKYKGGKWLTCENVFEDGASKASYVKCSWPEEASK